MSIFNVFSREDKKSVPIYRDTLGNEWVDLRYFGFGDLSRSKDKFDMVFPTAKESLEQYYVDRPWKEKWLSDGRSFASPKKSDCLLIHLLRAHIKGNCYNNSLRLALGREGRIIRWKPKKILYCEGVAVNPTGAYLHAWLLVDGKVYDPTWPDAYRATYFGIAFDPKFMLEFAEKTNQVSLLQNWHQAKKVL